MNRYRVEFYEKGNGKQPVREFLLSLDKRMRAKAADAIVLLRDNGHELREPYSKHVVDGIFELRIKLGSDTARILYFFIMGDCIILTNGFVKKTRKTPRVEIERARQYRKDYMKRKAEEE